MIMKEIFLIEKEEVFDLLSQKINDDLNLYYDHLSILTSYSKRQFIHLSHDILENDQSNKR
jgi:hypothetical protein